MIWLDRARDGHCKFIVGHGQRRIVTYGVLHRIAKVCGQFATPGTSCCAHHTLLLRPKDPPPAPGLPRDAMARARTTPHEDREPDLTEVMT